MLLETQEVSLEWMMVAVMMAAGTAMFVMGVIGERNQRGLHDESVVKIGDLTEGAHLIEGMVQGQDSLHAPFSKTACSWYRLKFSQKGERVWRTTGSLEPSTLTLVDDSGSVSVRVPQDLMLPRSAHGLCGKDPQAHALHTEHRGKPGGLVATAVTEHVLQEGQLVQAFGTFRDGLLVVGAPNHLGVDGLEAMQSREASASFVQMLVGPVVVLGALAWGFWPF